MAIIIVAVPGCDKPVAKNSPSVSEVRPSAPKVFLATDSVRRQFALQRVGDSSGGSGGGHAFSPVANDSATNNLNTGNNQFLADSNVSPQKEDVAAMKVEPQHPYAVVVMCSDSRVSPEVLYNQSLGNLFVVRTAGNVMDSVTIASIEYAVEQLNISTVFILGHDYCGAVKAAAKEWSHPGTVLPGSLPSITARIIPGFTPGQFITSAQLDSLKANPTDPGLWSLACYQNAHWQAVQLFNNSTIVRTGTQIYFGKVSMSAQNGFGKIPWPMYGLSRPN